MSTVLWPEPLPIIGGTGEHESGKTVFGLTIDPGPRTLVYDFENSCASYQNIIKSADGKPFDRIDVMTEMRKLYPSGYKPVDLFNWWLKSVRSIEAGKYTVIMADPITDVERGMADWADANPSFFGHTAGQYAKMSGIKWGDVKDYYKSILGDIATRCQTFYYTAHLGQEFEGNEATKKRKVKGKSTLNELASLFLWFERKPKADLSKPDKPTAYVRKNRLITGKWVDGELELHRVLPATMPVCTPKAIRDAFLNPAGGRATEDDERAQDESLTADEKLLIELKIAEAKRDAAMASHPTSPAAPTPDEPAGEQAFQVHARLAKLIDEATDKAQLIAAAESLKSDIEKCNGTHQNDLKAKFAAAKARINTPAQS